MNSIFTTQNVSATEYFPKVDRWLIPATVLPRTLAELALDGRVGNEGTCFWLGEKINSEAVISHVAILRGAGILKNPFNVTVSAELMRRLHDEMTSRKLILIAQIHSHSSECGVDMSPTDHAYGVSVPFFLSVICPDYAQNPRIKLTDCGVHVSLPERGYVKLSRKEITKRIVQKPNASLNTVVIGE